MNKETNFGYIKKVIVFIVLILIIITIYFFYKDNLKDVFLENKVTKEEKTEMINLVNQNLSYLNNKKDETVFNISKINTALEQTNISLEELKLIVPNDSRIKLIEESIIIMKGIIVSYNDYNSYVDSLLVKLSEKLIEIEKGKIENVEFTDFLTKEDKIGQDLLKIVNQKLEELKINNEKIRG